MIRYADGCSISEDMLPADLDCGGPALFERPSPEEQRELFHLRMMAIKNKSFDLARRAGRLIINSKCGTHTIDEALNDPEIYGGGSGKYSRAKIGIQLPSAYTHWSDLMLDIIDDSGLSRRGLARRLEISSTNIDGWAVGRVVPGQEARQKLLDYAREIGTI